MCATTMMSAALHAVIRLLLLLLLLTLPSSNSACIDIQRHPQHVNYTTNANYLDNIYEYIIFNGYDSWTQYFNPCDGSASFGTLDISWHLLSVNMEITPPSDYSQDNYYKMCADTCVAQYFCKEQRQTSLSARCRRRYQPMLPAYSEVQKTTILKETSFMTSKDVSQLLT